MPNKSEWHNHTELKHNYLMVHPYWETDKDKNKHTHTHT